MSRPYILLNPNNRAWKPEEDMLLLSYPNKTAGWINHYKIKHRSIGAISGRRAYLRKLAEQAA